MAENTIAASARTRVTPSRWIGMGWEIVKGDPGNFVLITLIAMTLTVAVSATVIGSFVVCGPLLAGMFIAVRRRIQAQRTEVMDLFAGFNHFVDLLLIFFLTFVFVIAGLVFCIFPAFIVGAFYLFPYLFLIDRKTGFWDAMESSRKLVTGDLPGFVVFLFLLLLLNLLGLILAGVGLLVTVPVSVAAITVAYQELVGFQPRPPETRGPVVIP